MSTQINKLKQELTQLQKRIQDYHSEHTRLVDRLGIAQRDRALAETSANQAEEEFKASCVGGGNEASVRSNLVGAREEVELAALRVQALQNALETHEKSTDLRALEENLRTRTKMCWEVVRDLEIETALKKVEDILQKAFAASLLAPTYSSSMRDFLRIYVGTKIVSPTLDDVRTIQDELAHQHGLPCN